MTFKEKKNVLKIIKTDGYFEDMSVDTVWEFDSPEGERMYAAFF